MLIHGRKVLQNHIVASSFTACRYFYTLWDIVKWLAHAGEFYNTLVEIVIAGLLHICSDIIAIAHAIRLEGHSRLPLIKIRAIGHQHARTGHIDQLAQILALI